MCICFNSIYQDCAMLLGWFDRPSPGLCTDNGAMVAALGSLMVSAGRSPSPVAFDADSSLPVTTVSLS